jgi:hypothetical protein
VLRAAVTEHPPSSFGSDFVVLPAVPVSADDPPASFAAPPAGFFAPPVAAAVVSDVDADPPVALDLPPDGATMLALPPVGGRTSARHGTAMAKNNDMTPVVSKLALLMTSSPL